MSPSSARSKLSILKERLKKYLSYIIQARILSPSKVYNQPTTITECGSQQILG
jgi:hypothetical protein